MSTTTDQNTGYTSTGSTTYEISDGAMGYAARGDSPEHAAAQFARGYDGPTDTEIEVRDVEGDSLWAGTVAESLRLEE